jgi:hypothetical protein
MLRRTREAARGRYDTGALAVEQATVVVEFLDW